MSGFAGFFMFFLSFLPLWVSVLFLDFKSILEKNPYTYTEKVSIVLIMLTFLVSFLVLKRILNPYDSGGSSVYTIIQQAKRKPSHPNSFCLICYPYSPSILHCGIKSFYFLFSFLSLPIYPSIIIISA